MKRVLILLSTYNGEKYLREQLDSLYAQVGVEFHILVRDDGSSDNTVAILEEYNQKHSNITTITGNNLRAIRSFYALINYTLENRLIYDYYAFCDQDDVWKPNKLEDAIAQIEKSKSNRAFYFCAAEYVDSDLNHIGVKYIPDKGDYKSAIIRNYSLGCTIVLTKQLFFECSEASQTYQKRISVGYIPYHDVWFYSYALCTKATVIYDSNSHILYRQHSSNVTHASKNMYKRLWLAYKSQKRVRNSHEQLAGLLLKTGQINDKDVIRYLTDISEYRKTIRNTIQLFFNIDTSSCNKLDSFLWRMLVLLHRF